MILVTGASGLLGASLVSLAQESGREVAGLYHRHPVQIAGAVLHAVDLTDDTAVNRVFEELKPTVVIHCAAVTNVDWCEEHPEAARAVNVLGTATIAKISARMNARLLYVSTDAVFDGIRGQYSETDQATPVNIYARTKLQGEEETLRYCPAATIARVNMYGWNVQNKESLAEWILGRLMGGNPVPGFTDVSFCPIFANDLAAILLEMSNRNLPGLYHVVGAEPVSKYEFARQVALTFGFDLEQVVATRVADAKLKAPRPNNTTLNTQKVCAAIGHPMPNVGEGLRRFARMRDRGQRDRLNGQMTGVGK